MSALLTQLDPATRPSLARAALGMMRRPIQYGLTGTGVMWLGTFDPASATWIDHSVQLTDTEILPPPQQLSDQVMALTTTVNVRNGYPPNDKAYLRAVRAIGVAVTGTHAGVQQIWAQIDVALRPHIGFEAAD